MEMVKMSEKGQLVVPEKLRKQEGFKSGDRFIAVPVEDGVVFKRVDLRAEIEQLAKEIRAEFKQKKVTKKILAEAIQWARSQSS
jgi:bifunctional DNA-binding transcriptional regulator/antitoxin component of YhaV-PrlF toxin-antitoxin module